MRNEGETERLVAAVRAYAVERYTEGWDTIVEAWDDADIADAIGGARTLEGALRKLRPIVGVYADRQAGAAQERKAEEAAQERERAAQAEVQRPMTFEEAEQVLENAAEMRAELGSGWVFGGGNPADAAAAANQALPRQLREAEAEARRVVGDIR